MAGVRWVAAVCLMVVVWTSTPSAALAQIGAGALAGRVTDQAGTAVPGATVTVTAVGTNSTRTGVTDVDGGYFVQGLAPGAYRVRVELSGFRPLTREGVRLATGETVRLDLQLEVGGLTEAVTVTADAPLLRSETSGLGHVIDNTQDRRPAAERPQLHHARRPRARRGAAARARRCRASTADGRAPTSICSTASRCCSRSPDRSRSSRTSTRSRSSRSRATARRRSSAASTAASST